MIRHVAYIIIPHWMLSPLNSNVATNIFPVMNVTMNQPITRRRYGQKKNAMKKQYYVAYAKMK